MLHLWFSSRFTYKIPFNITKVVHVKVRNNQEKQDKNKQKKQCSL